MSDIKNSIPGNYEEDLLADPNEVEAAPPPSDGELKEVRDLAAQQLLIARRIAWLEDKLKAEKIAYEAIRQQKLPLAMTAIGIRSMDLVGGGSVTIEEGVFAGIKKENAEKAHEWLEADGQGALIKHKITVEFGKGEEAWFKKFVSDLNKRKKPLKWDRSDTVNFQTLGKFVRDRVAELKKVGVDPRVGVIDEETGKPKPGTFLPYELLGIYEATWAEVKLPEPK